MGYLLIRLIFCANVVVVMVKGQTQVLDRTLENRLVHVVAFDVHNQPVKRLPITSAQFWSIYSFLGIGREELSKWESQYGYDSAGIGENGKMLIEGFPVFSKLTWTFIDPTNLSFDETIALEEECNLLLKRQIGEPAKTIIRELLDIAKLAVGADMYLVVGG